MIAELTKIRFLKDLPETVLAKVAPVAKKVTCDEEQILIRQDETLTQVYMLVSGKIFLNCRASSGQSLTLDEIREGQTFGLSSLLGKSASTYTAICAEESVLLTLDSEQLLSLFSEDYVTGFQVMQQVVVRFKNRMQRHTRLFIRALSAHPDVRFSPEP